MTGIEIEAQTASQARNIWERRETQRDLQNIKTDIVQPIEDIKNDLEVNLVQQVDNDEIAREQETFKKGVYKKVNELIKKQKETDEKLDKILELLGDGKNGK